MSWADSFMDELQKISVATAVPVVDETDAQIRQHLRKRYRTSPFLAGSMATGLSIPGKADYDYGMVVQSLPKFQKLLNQMHGEMEASPYNVPGTDYHVFKTQVGDKPVDVSLMFGEKGRQQREAIKRVAQSLTPEQKAAIVKRKQELKNSWLLPEFRYKRYKRGLDQELGLPRFKREMIPELAAAPEKVADVLTRSDIFGHRTDNLDPIVHSGKLLSALQLARSGVLRSYEGSERGERLTGDELKDRKLRSEVFFSKGLLPADAGYGKYGVLFRSRKARPSPYLNFIPTEHVSDKITSKMTFVVPEDEHASWTAKFPNHKFITEADVPESKRLQAKDYFSPFRKILGGDFRVFQAGGKVGDQDAVG